MTRRARVVTTSTLCALAAGSLSASAAVAGSRWTGGGSGAVTVVSDGSTTDPELRYVARRRLKGSWWFRTTAASDGRLAIDYVYEAAHADLLVAARLESFVTHDGETQITKLASGRALICCPRSGGRRFRGTAVLDVKAGDAYGFLMSGSNLDIGRLAGALRLTPGNRPPVLAAPELRVRSGDSMTFALNASDPDGDEVSSSIVDPPAHGTLTSSAGSYVYRASRGFAGRDTFAVGLTDARGATAAARVDIEVLAPRVGNAGSGRADSGMDPVRQTPVDPPSSAPFAGLTPAVGGFRPVAGDSRRDPAQASRPPGPDGGRRRPRQSRRVGAGPARRDMRPRAVSRDPDALVNDNPRRSDVIALLRRPDNVPLGFDDVARSLNITLVLLLALGLPARVFNKTVQRNRAELDRGFAPLRAIAEAVTPPAARRLLGVAGISALTAALVLVFLDPRFPDRRMPGSFVLGMLLASAVVVATQYTTWKRYLRRRAPEVSGGWAVYAGQVAVSVLCVTVSRAGHFVPGLMFGMHGDYEPRSPLSLERAGRRIIFTFGTLLLVSLIAWTASIPVGHAAAAASASSATLVLDAALAALASIGMQSIAFGLVPLMFLDGHVLARGYPGWWLALWSAGLGWLSLVVINPALWHQPAYEPSTGWLVGLLAFEAVVAFGLWSFFAARARAGSADVARA